MRYLVGILLLLFIFITPVQSQESEIRDKLQSKMEALAKKVETVPVQEPAFGNAYTGLGISWDLSWAIDVDSYGKINGIHTSDTDGSSGSSGGTHSYTATSNMTFGSRTTQATCIGTVTANDDSGSNKIDLKASYDWEGDVVTVSGSGEESVAANGCEVPAIDHVYCSTAGTYYADVRVTIDANEDGTDPNSSTYLFPSVELWASIKDADGTVRVDVLAYPESRTSWKIFGTPSGTVTKNLSDFPVTYTFTDVPIKLDPTTKTWVQVWAGKEEPDIYTHVVKVPEGTDLQANENPNGFIRIEIITLSTSP